MNPEPYGRNFVPTRNIPLKEEWTDVEEVPTVVAEEEARPICPLCRTLIDISDKVINWDRVPAHGKCYRAARHQKLGIVKKKPGRPRTALTVVIPEHLDDSMKNYDEAAYQYFYAQKKLGVVTSPQRQMRKGKTLHKI